MRNSNCQIHIESERTTFDGRIVSETSLYYKVKHDVRKEIGDVFMKTHPDIKVVPGNKWLETKQKGKK